ncbi:MAG: hypothetical protein II337_04490, partial [Clostridia bacterium]|nr:hypothetical protein [Clostridia bacterium]
MKKQIRIVSLLMALLFALCAFAACTPKDDDTDAATPKTITVEVVHKNGETKTFTITTTAATLRGALDQENLVEGDESEFGLYNKVVDGERADYDTDKAYWGLYKGDE